MTTVMSTMIQPDFLPGISSRSTIAEVDSGEPKSGSPFGDEVEGVFLRQFRNGFDVIDGW